MQKDVINLLRKVEGEYLPRVYTMSGAEFQVMLDAIKALPERKFRDVYDFKYWHIRAAGLQALRDQGFTIEQQPDLFVMLLEDYDRFHHSYDGSYRAHYSIQMRRETGEPPAIGITGIDPVVKFYISEAFIEKRRAKLTDLNAKYGLSSASIEMAQKSGLQDATKLYQERIRAIFNKESASRTMEAYKKALNAVRDMVQQDKTPHHTSYVALVLDGEDVVVSEEHEAAQAFILEVKRREAEKNEAARQAREAEKRQRLENAPQLVDEWLHRCNKSEIADGLYRHAQISLDEKSLKKQTKAQMIASVVADRALCEKLIASIYHYQ